jgi:ribosome-binding protein aMBF1 (putative translation factor)
MSNKRVYTFQEDLKRRFKNPRFKKAWDKSEPEYLLAKQLIEARLSQKISQRALARKLHTSQAALSRLETMRANPSLSLLKRIAHALETKFVLPIE